MSTTSSELKRFARKAAILCLPFLIYFGVAVVVDPFEHFGLSKAVAHTRKQRISGLMHHPLWKSHQYLKDPAPRVIFGDSRLDKIPAEKLEEITGHHYFNFCFGGGTIAEMSAAFWFATKHSKLEEVTFGISFFNFSANENMNRFVEAEALVNDDLLYLVNRTVARASAHLLWAELTSGIPNLEKPPMSRDEFWAFQLRVGAPRIYARYVYPTNYEAELERIVAYCKEQGISIRFVVPPSHTDLQRKVAEFGLEAEQIRFRAFITGLAPTIDFDVDSELTRDPERFGDPFHARADNEIAEEVWGNRRGLARHSEPEPRAALP